MIREWRRAGASVIRFVRAHLGEIAG